MWQLAELKVTLFKLSRPKDVDGISYDDSSYTSVKLNNDLYLYLKQVNKFLAFVCVIREEVFNENRGKPINTPDAVNMLTLRPCLKVAWACAQRFRIESHRTASVTYCNRTVPQL